MIFERFFFLNFGHIKAQLILLVKVIVYHYFTTATVKIIVHVKLLINAKFKVCSIDIESFDHLKNSKDESFVDLKMDTGKTKVVCKNKDLKIFTGTFYLDESFIECFENGAIIGNYPCIG